jgi:hypothetical protein
LFVGGGHQWSSVQFDAMAKPDESEANAQSVEEERAASRADQLLPEERAAGSGDPQAQADAILADSDRRSEDRAGPSDASAEHRTSDEATEPAG